MYYLARKSFEPKVSGIPDRSPQGDLLRQGEDSGNLDDVVSYLTNVEHRYYARFPKKGFYVKGFELDPRAKLTDQLTIANIRRDFVISDKALDIFKKYNLPDHHVTKVDIFQNKEVTTTYNWIMFKPVYEEVIDFSASQFYEAGLANRKIRDVEISDFASYEAFRKTHKVGFEKLCYNNNLDTSMDLLRLNFCVYDVYLKDTLVTDLMKNGITGFNFFHPDKRLKFQ